jgi:uncharacterized protein (TIGR00661 family)
MKKIIYYISDHGNGHATRTIAIIRELQKKNIQVIIRNSNSLKLIKNALPENEIIEGITDVGPIIKNDGISIDEDKSSHVIMKWIQNIEKTSYQESKFIKKHEPNLIISDISVMPLLSGKMCNIPSITISNFSWYDVLKFLPKKTLNKINQLYEYSDLHIQLPLSTSLNHFKNKKTVGFVVRKPTITKNDLKRKLGIKKNEFSVLIALDDFNKIKFDNYKNFKFLTMKPNKSKNTINVNNWTEGQNLVSAVDLVICKCGYGFISECITNSTPFFYLTSKNHMEQIAISKEVKKYGLKNQISFNDLENIKFTEKFMNKLPLINSQKIDNQNTINLIKEYL